MIDEQIINDIPTTISGEIALLRSHLPKVQITSATNHFLAASYARTKYTRIKITLTFPEDYPSQHVIVDILSDEVVPAGLKKILERELSKVAVEYANTHKQVYAVFQKLVHFVDNNKFVPCWRELKQCRDLIHNKQQDQDGSLCESKLALLETKGKVKLRLQNDQYYYCCSIIINDNYPSTTKIEDYGKACDLHMESTNLPPKIELMLSTQARDLVHRMQDGMSPTDALKMSNPIRLPKNFKGDTKAPVKTRLTQATLKDLKRDVETLKKVHNLREVDSATVEWNAKIKAHDAKARKEARRNINKMTKSEISNDLNKEAKEKQWQIEEKARLAGYNFSEYDGSNPQPSLFSLVTFLIEKIQYLPLQICPICKKRALPKNPKKLESLYLTSNQAKTEKEKKERKASKLKRPIRTFCGCWYHYECLDKHMTEPPFGATCATVDCGRRVFHPNWPSDIKQMEKAWAMKQARAREIEDAAMFL